MLIKKALNKAYDLHQWQHRKGSNFPYYVHILDVARILMYETDISEEIIVAGILHDTLEDSPYTPSNLKEEFGENIFRLVNFCTEPGNTNDVADDEQIKSWKNRKIHSVDSLNSWKEDELLVFLADKLANLQSMKDDLVLMEDKLWEKFNAPYEDIKWYYTSILNNVKPNLEKRRIFKLFEKLVSEVFSN